MQAFTSELAAVNKIIAIDGSSPVQTLQDDYLQAIIARRVLGEWSRKIQNAGWYFNEEESVTLNPDLNGLITIPLNVAKCLVQNVNGSVVQRGQKMYDKQQRTYTFTQPITADLVTILDWNELPEEARSYIIDMASIEYNDNYFGNQDIKTDLERKAQASFLALKDADTEARNINLMDNPRTHNIAFKNRNRKA